MLLNLYKFAKIREESSIESAKNRKGVPLSEETKRKVSIANKGKNTAPKSLEHRKALSEAAKHRRLNATKGRICIYNEKTKKKKYVKPEELDAYLAEGWIRGGIPQTEEVKKIIGLNSKKCLTGGKRSEQAKRKTSETLKKLAQDPNSSYYKKVRRKEVDKDNE